MSKGKALILSNYLCLLGWWLILTFTGSREGLGNVFYLLGMGVYAFVLSLSLAGAASGLSMLHRYRLPVVVISIGMSLFGLGTMLWFYNEFFGGMEVPFPSLSDVFYVAQFPFSVFGIMFFLKDGAFRRLRDYIGLVLKVLIFVLSIFGITYIAVRSFSDHVDLSTYLLYYYSLESLSILILYIFSYRIAHSLGTRMFSAPSFAYVLLGQALWFAADGLFFYDIVTETMYDANYSDLLYVTSVFFILFGLASLIDESKEEGFFSPIGPVYFQKTSVYNAIDLHLRRFSVWLLSKQPRSARSVSAADVIINP